MFRLLKSAVELSEQYRFSTFVKMGLQYIFLQLLFAPFFPYAMHRIRKIDKDYSLDELVNFTFTFCFGLIKPLQIHYELFELLKILDEKKPKYILEIGTAYGGTLFLFTRVTSDNAVIISIDLPSGSFGGGYSKARIPLYIEFALNNQQIHLIRKDSHKEETLEEIKDILNGNELDFLFIDGDHTYEGVKRDFKLYSPMVKRNGTIALHDIVGSNIKGCEVSKFWEEIKSKHDNIEIAEDWKQNWAGIGVIKMM
jgi:cephalosporin hydroxylase